MVLPLTYREIMILLQALASKYGPGYSHQPEVGRLQAKLSIALEMSMKEDPKEGG
jgi:hypothetical protein